MGAGSRRRVPPRPCPHAAVELAIKDRKAGADANHLPLAHFAANGVRLAPRRRSIGSQPVPLAEPARRHRRPRLPRRGPTAAHPAARRSRRPGPPRGPPEAAHARPMVMGPPHSPTPSSLYAHCQLLHRSEQPPAASCAANEHEHRRQTPTLEFDLTRPHTGLQRPARQGGVGHRTRRHLQSHWSVYPG